MVKSNIVIRATDDPAILELELLMAGSSPALSSLDAILWRHGLRCHSRYVIKTDLRTILRARVSCVGRSVIHTQEIVSLLESLRQSQVVEISARAA